MTLEQHYRIEDVDGTRIVMERVPSARSTSIGIWIPVGSRDERDDELGYAHFVEHLLFKGNPQRDATAISRFFDGIGSDINAATTREYTVVHTRVLGRHVAAALDVLGDMVWRPAFLTADVDSERQVILEEIAMYADSPSDVAHELADELLFGGHGLGRPIVGTAGSIEPASPAGLGTFHERAYDPSRIVVSAAGDLDPDEFVQLIREHFLAGQVAPSQTRVEPRVAPVAGPVERMRCKQAEQVQQAHLCLAWPGIARRDPRRFAASVLDTVLGGTPGSRLFVEVREQRGLAYSVYSFQSQYSDAGQLGIYLGVRPDRVTDALDVVAEQLERVCREPISDEELQRAKDHIEGRTLLSMESTTVRGNRLGGALVAGLEIEPVEDLLRSIREVDAGQVRELAAEMLSLDRLALAAVAEDAEAVERVACNALGMAPVNIDAAETCP